jgi:hypothetical protein
MPMPNDAPHGTELVLSALLSANGRLRTPVEIASRLSSISQEEVNDALAFLGRVGLAHELHGFYFASAPAEDAAGLLES